MTKQQLKPLMAIIYVTIDQVRFPNRDSPTTNHLNSHSSHSDLYNTYLTG